MILRTSQAVLAAVVVVTTVGVTRAHDGDAWMHAEVARLLAVERAATSATPSEGPATAAATAPAGYGATMAASFGVFKPRVRSYFDATTFYVESDNVPDNSRMPTPMVGITSWQQQIPLPASYFASTTNPERDRGSIGFGKPNVWRLPLVPTPSASPIPISAGNFQRGAIALGADGIAIFNPRNNTGRVAYEIGELDLYGGHCGRADDYHYHIAPVHLQAVTGIDKPIAWALDGYPIYGYTEPDGRARQGLDAEGGHNHGAWSYHYHAIGSAATGPAAPYLPTAFHGTVVNFGGQVDGQPTIGSLRESGNNGYTAQPVAGARIIAFKNPVALDTDAAGNLVESLTGVPSPDQFLMRVQIGGATYDECWRINRAANPKTVTVTWRLPSIAPTTATYNNGNNRLTAYAMGSPSLLKLPDTGQTLDATPTFGEDSDYTINPPSYTDNGDGTITDKVTGLMWQKVDNGESTWENAVARVGSVPTGGYTDWRLPTPTELFSILNFNNGNPAALNTTFFPSNPAGAAEYWWSSDIYGADATKIWCVNSGAGMGPKPKAETVSAGGTLRYHARYVRGAKPTNGHNYQNNLDGTVTDLDAGLMWTQVPASARNWNAALSYAEGLTLEGYSDWRLPNIKELQSLVDFTLATATTANGALAPVNRVLFPSATTPATAYWSSTALRSGGNNSATHAWLVEFGINNSVPAANGPPRNAQGLISYEVMTSSFPVFAVRAVTQATPPVITAQPNAFQRVVEGATVNLAVAATSDSPITYQWKKDGVAITAGSSAALSLSGVKAAESGTYTVTLTNATGAVTSGNAVVALGTSRLVNLSVRSTAGTGSETLTVGFVVGGGAAPSLMIRGIGPTLGTFGVAGVVADPVLTVLSPTSAVVATNDDWGTATNVAQITTTAAQFGGFALSAGSRDAALISSLPTGAYTAQLTSKATSAGVALVEVYDVSAAGAIAPLVNLSARTRVGTGPEVLIAGFVISGAEPKRLLIRGIGPTLGTFGVAGTLADPQLAVFKQGVATALQQNDNWSGGTNSAELIATAVRVGSFALPAGSRDAVLLVVLEPGVYTAQVSGVGATTGVGLLEIYDVP